MENTKGKIDHILSKNGRDRLLVACFYAIAALSFCTCYLYFSKEKMRVDYDSSIKEINARYEQDKIDNLKRQNDYLFGLSKQIDSAKAALEIYNIQKKMK